MLIDGAWTKSFQHNFNLIMRNKVLWFTGLSGSGKTTIANSLSEILIKQNYKVKILDGDEIRESIHSDLGFSPEDIAVNNQKVAFLCKEMIGTYDFIIVPIISPFSRSRKIAREIIGLHFFEIYIKSSLDYVISRDVKGLYKKALNGEIDNFIGIDPTVPYEIPTNPDIIIDTKTEKISESVLKLLKFIKIESEL